MTPRDVAHWLAENHGWHVFPVQANKTPLPGMRWKEIASDSHDAIDAMPWEGAAFPAVYCRKSGISVLDIDTVDGRLELQKMLGGLPSTMQQQTPRGGTHLIFSAPKAFEQSIGTGVPCDGVDIRSGDGYIVWYGKGDGLDWDMLPWPFTAPVSKAKKPEKVVNSCNLGNVEGSRNDGLAREAGAILAAKANTSLPSLILQLAKFNSTMNFPPLEAWEVEKTAKSIFNKACMAVDNTVVPDGYDLGDMMEMDFGEIRYICPPFVAEGYTVYAGKPKIGKTTLMRQLLIAAHNGLPFMGFDCLRTKCLFLSLEEGPRIIKKKFAGMGATPDMLRGVRVEFNWSKGDEAIADLRLYMAKEPDVKLIIIDTLSRIRGGMGRGQTLFQYEYDQGAQLQQLCKDYPGLAIIALHHTRKMQTDDPAELISGTNGVLAACDMFCILHKGPDAFFMHWQGRLWEQDDNDFEVMRAGGAWAYVGVADDTKNLPSNATAQGLIYRLLKDKGEMTQASIAIKLDMDKGNVSKHIKELEKRGMVCRGDIGVRASL